MVLSFLCIFSTWPFPWGWYALTLTFSHIYFSFILSYFSYCATSVVSAKLEKVNERALRFIYSDYYSTYAILQQKWKLISLEYQRYAGAHNEERLTSILRLCSGVFTSRVILDKLFPQIAFSKPITSNCVINNIFFMRNHYMLFTLSMNTWRIHEWYI